MATVTSGLSYAIYTLSARYIFPLIKPPTPPQLESDKASIDESFSQAFALIDQLASDTAALKSSEQERTEKLDRALEDVDAICQDLKDMNKRRENENRFLTDQVQGLRDLVPQALEGWKSREDGRLEDLGNELQSLKKLIGNRMGNSVGVGISPRTNSAFRNERGRDMGTPDAGGSETGNSTPTFNVTPGSGKVGHEPPKSESTTPASGAMGPKYDGSAQGKRPGGKAAIPAWQMAAAGSGEKSRETNGQTASSVDTNA